MPKPNQTEEVKPIEARHKTLFPHGLQICLLLLLCINKKIDPAFVFIAPCRAGSSMLSYILGIHMVGLFDSSPRHSKTLGHFYMCDVRNCVYV